MLRFLPDSWLEGLLRPALMADPSAGLYYEDGAPDWRFLALLVVVVLAAFTGRLRKQLTPEHGRLLLMLCVMFYTWAFTIGNGRYFIAGLLMVGPLLVMAWQWLPGTRGFRWTLLLGFMLVQAFTAYSMYRPGAWALVGWARGPAVLASPSPVREKPAVFVTVTAISYSVLVPSFHPESRWANLSGQVDMAPSRPEYPRARALLDLPLPKFVVVPASQGKGEPEPQPSPIMWRMISLALSEHGLEPASDQCESIRTNLTRHGLNERGQPVPEGAFWVCPIRLRTAAPSTAKPSVDEMNDVFARLEAYCPRFFPPGEGVTRRNEDHWLRYYLGSDTRIFVEDAGFVTYKYYRHFTPTVIGSVEDLRQGKFQFNCSKLDGRYRPPWAYW